MSQARPHPALVTREAAHWHALQREGELNAAQRAQFMDWLVASPDHLREYLAITRIAGELGEALRGMPVDLDRAATDQPGQALPDNVVALPLRPRATPAQPRRTGLRRGAAIAAGLACLALAGIATQLAWPQDERYVAAHGQPRRFELPDRTVVHLDAESELSLRFGPFRRDVELVRGQASFIVAAGRRPFQVRAGGLQVQDIGTTFGVALQRDRARIDVLEGRVRVLGDNGAARPLADLRAGQSARIDYRDHRVELSREDAEAMTGWWQRRVVFRDEPLDEVADRFNRLNRVRLVVEDPAAGAMRLTGNLRGDDLDSLRAFLDDQAALQTTMTANEIRVRSRAARAGATQVR
ncbi:FecR domain-containing protein [Stenotrophomonas sp. MMGLT7]|uniref:FecR family protein n=1 Tax=Stenotrophomonas sp. MMGLT7 TaxID=2901227 RepID=UPI001E5B8BB8|nr:FecR domain-containing protein [Stenotrophomonas sp. MMGLT7]